ncbi:MAG: hypothetical protein AAF938_29765, partial [Myxococcota bacterium]
MLSAKLIVGSLVGFLIAFILYRLLHWQLRAHFPPPIPAELAFVHEFGSDLKAREAAEALARRFPSPVGSVTCLGPVRGNAARVLFHS